MFDYRTNHLYLPWSNSHKSRTPTIPETFATQADGDADYRNRDRHPTAVAWPRPVEAHGSSDVQGTGTAIGLDGADDRLLGAGSPRLTARQRTRTVELEAARQESTRTTSPPGQARHGDRSPSTQMNRTCQVNLNPSRGSIRSVERGVAIPNGPGAVDMLRPDPNNPALLSAWARIENRE